MIERKRGHIVGISSLAGVCAFPEAVVYTTSKMGVRGFMEALAIQLHHEGLDKYIKTSTVFLYFVDTNPYVRDAILEGSQQKVLHSAEFATKGLVNGILREDEIIAVPKEIYYGMYLM